MIDSRIVRRGQDTLVTATWNINSVIAPAVLLENLASTSSTSSLVRRRETSNTMPTSPCETMIVAEDGKLSSGSAELKSQSSSAAAPFAALDPFEAAAAAVRDAVVGL